uniref:Pentatricopeptide repeat-containing protein n=1 Tax=Kalanchoe fedtschenkoi TaxID=63787 RepID=A0A7N0TVY5_KALFE
MELLSCSALIRAAAPPPTILPPPAAVSTSKLKSSAFTAVRQSQPSPTSCGPASLSVQHSTYYAKRQAAILEFQTSSDLNSALLSFGEMLKVQDLNAILRHFGKLNRSQDISMLFEWMRKHGKINVASYSTYMKLMGRSLSAAKAVEIYDGIPEKSTRVDPAVCNSVLGCLVRNGKFENTIKLFEKMKLDGLVPDVYTCSTLLSGCMKISDGYAKAMKLVRELQENELRMDGVIYGTLLAVCASNNRREEAEVYFNRMKDEGHSPNIFHYSSLLNAYSSEGDYKKADELVQEMKSAGLVPNKVMLTTLLKVYVRGGLFQKAKELLAELEDLGYADDEMPYCLLMDSLAKTGQVNEARSIFVEMREKQVRSEGYAYSIMISAFCRAGLLEEAKQLAVDYEASSEKFDVVILNTMLCAYCRAGEMDSVMQTMRKMDEFSISPDDKTFQILIKYFVKEKLYMLAYQTMSDMHSKGYQPTEELATSLMFHLGKTRAHAEAFSVYNIIRYGKRTICKTLHESILHILIDGHLLKDAYVVAKDNAKSIRRPAMKKFANSFMKWGNINLINDVFKALHGSGYKIDKAAFGKAIARYIAEPEKKELLLQLLRWMTGQGYAVDSVSRNLILKNSHLFGRQLVAEILSKQHAVSKES